VNNLSPILRVVLVAALAGLGFLFAHWISHGGTVEFAG
jgi:hypothetical protein